MPQMITTFLHVVVYSDSLICLEYKRLYRVQNASNPNLRHKATHNLCWHVDHLNVGRMQ
jgi:hypothetical protein